MNFDAGAQPEPETDLRILQEIERNPEVTQASLATQMGVAVGKVNWYVRRLINKGYVKVTHLQRRKLHYFLTPAGLTLKLELTRGYLEASLRVYRELRAAAQEVVLEVRRRGYAAITLDGEDEATEILRLTCLEQGVGVQQAPGRLPTARAAGVGFEMEWPDEGDEAGRAEGLPDGSCR